MEKQANQANEAPAYLIYGGNRHEKESHAELLGCQSARDLIKKLH
jgi:hypothetical protein